MVVLKKQMLQKNLIILKESTRTCLFKRKKELKEHLNIKNQKIKESERKIKTIKGITNQK